MHNGSVNGRGFFGADAWSILEVSMLSLLLSLEVKTRKSTEILLDDCLVDSGTTPDTLTVVMCH